MMQKSKELQIKEVLYSFYLSAKKSD